MKNHLSMLLLAGSCAVLLGGCMSGPDYEQPEMEMPDAWHQAVQDELGSGEPTLQTWWTVFGDDTLDSLVTRASTNNLTLKTAAARVEQAAAQRGVSASQYWPDIVGAGAATAFKNSGAGMPDGFGQDGGRFQAGLSMAWEIDLWGRVRRSVESADASLQASVENYRDILVLLYAEIAVNYIEVRTLQERIQFAENNLKAQAATMKLTKNRFDAGLVPALDVSQAELNRSRTASQIPPLRQRLVAAINRLGVLTGDMPYALLRNLETPQPIPVASGEMVARGLPADLLRQRPDIRRAERELAAQNARIGARQAELYPTLVIPGTLTLEAVGGTPNDSSGVAYGFGPQLRWNIFNGRRIRSEIDAERAGTKAALHTYEQTVLVALEEVENFMSAYAQEQDRIQSLETAAASAKKSVELVQELYTSGLTDFQNVLNMEQALLVQQDALSVSRGAVIEGIVKGRFSLLLFSFVLMFLVLPLVPAERGLLDKGIGFFGLAVLLSCLRAITSSRGFFVFMAALSLLNVGLGGTEILGTANSDSFKILVLAFRLFYYLLIFGSIMGYVLSASPVTGNKIAGAISAYLLMGIVWAVAYALFFLSNPESFSLPEALQTNGTMGLWPFYFSFTTLTTLGYGDVVPRLPAVQSYAVIEAACGQVFLAVLVSRLVALQIIHSKDNES